MKRSFIEETISMSPLRDSEQSVLVEEKCEKE